MALQSVQEEGQTDCILTILLATVIGSDSQATEEPRQGTHCCYLSPGSYTVVSKVESSLTVLLRWLLTLTAYLIQQGYEV